MKYVHTNIISSDWKALVEFYVEVFSCKIKPPIRKQSGDWLARGTGVPDAALEGAHLILPGYNDDGPTLEIYQYKNTLSHIPISANTRGLGHIAFEVDDVKRVLLNIIKHGGAKEGDVITRYIDGVGELTYTYARDPDGNLIEIQSWSEIDR